MLRFSFKQVQDYAHSAALYVAKFQSSSGSSYRFKVFEAPDRTFLDDDHLFETQSLSEIVAFVRGYRKAVGKALRMMKAEPPAMYHNPPVAASRPSGEAVQKMVIRRKAGKSVDKIKEQQAL